MYILLNNTNSVLLGPFVDDTDGKTAETGLAGSMTVYLSKNGAASAARHSTTAITHDRLGYYLVPLDTTDCNTPGVLTVFASPSGALPVRRDYALLFPDAWNFLFPGTTLAVNVSAWDDDTDPVTGAAAFLSNTAALANLLAFVSTGYNASASTIGTATNLTNAPTGGVDVVKVGGSTTAATNLKKDYDGTGYSKAASTIGAASAVTGTVKADLRQLNGSAGTDFGALVGLAQAAVVGLVNAGTNTTTVVTTLLPSAVTGFYVGKTFIATSGSNAKQGGKLVTAYDGATKRLTLDAPLTAAMTAGDTFVLVG